MIRSISIPDALYERLKKIAEEYGVTVVTVIKLACKEYADKYEK